MKKIYFLQKPEFSKTCSIPLSLNNSNNYYFLSETCVGVVENTFFDPQSHWPEGGMCAARGHLCFGEIQVSIENRLHGNMANLNDQITVA